MTIPDAYACILAIVCLMLSFRLGLGLSWVWSIAGTVMCGLFILATVLVVAAISFHRFTNS